MSDEYIILFTMINGLQFASEGTLQSVRDVKGEWYRAVQPELKTTYLINLSNTVSVQVIPREAVHLGQNKLLVPDKKILH
jgi:hypothetical protein